MCIGFQVLSLRYLREAAGLSGHLAVAVKLRLVIRGLCGKSRRGLLDAGILSHGGERLGSLYRLLRSSLLIAESGLE